MNLLLFLLIGFGLTTIITKGRIFEPVRNYFDNGIDDMKYNFYGLLITCPMCVGFWTGIFLSFTLFSPTDLYIYVGTNISTAKYISELIFSSFFDGCLLGGVAWSIHVLLSLLNRLYEHTLNVEIFEEEKLKFEEKRNQTVLTGTNNQSTGKVQSYMSIDEFTKFRDEMEKQNKINQETGKQILLD